MKKWRQDIEAFGLKSLAFLLRTLPHQTSLRLGESLGGLAYRIGIRREVTIDNLTQAFPEWDRTKIESTARACYRHFGALVCEFTRLPLLNPGNVDKLVENDNWDVFDEAQRRGKGGVVVSGHFGIWELKGAAAAVKGYPISYIVTGQQNKRVEALIDEYRGGVGIRIIKKRDAVKGVIKALRENRIIAIMSDQDAHEAGVFVQFFNRPASTPKGAAMFALRTGAALIFAECFRRKNERLKIIMEFIPMDDLPEDREEAIFELTQRFTTRLEEAIRRHPEQWFWMHRRWKTSPPEKK